MLAAIAIDTVNADAVEVGDQIEVDGIFGKVLDLDDQGDMIVLRIEDDQTGDEDEIPLFPTDRVTILG